jgi:hypothetical protein
MENQSTLQQHAIRWGVIIAIINIVIYTVFYAIDVSMLVSSWIGITQFAILVGLIIYAGIDFRKLSGGFLAFKQAFVHAFVIMIISGLIGLVYRYILFGLIDPGAVDAMVEATINNTVAIMERFGVAGSDEMDKAMEAAEMGIREGFTLGGMLKGFLWSILFYAIGAAIVGAIVKKNEPETL